nr:MFS transporter [Prescottella sp. R16]
MTHTPDSTSTPATPLPKEIWVLVAAAFIVAVGFGIVAPVLPQFARSFDVGVTAASAVISAFALMRLMFAPLSGSLVQRLGERPTYLTGLLITAMSTGACAFAETYWQLLLFRGLGGIGSTMFTVSALGLLVRISPPDGRGRVSGVYSAAFLIGTITGPLFGGALAGFGLRVPFVIYAVALLIAAGVVYLALRKSHLAEPEGDSGLTTMTLLDGARSPLFRAALGSNFVTGWVIFGVRISLVPLFVVEVLGGSGAMAAIALTVFALGNTAVLMQSGRWSDRIGRKPFVLLGLVVCGVSTVVMGQTTNLVLFFVATAVCGLGSGIMGPPQQAAVADVIGSKRRGGPVLAVYQMANDIGTFSGPLVAGVVVQEFSYGAAWTVTGGVMLLPVLLWMFAPGGRYDADTTLTAGSGDPDTDEYTDGVRGADGDGTEQQLPERAVEHGPVGEPGREPAREQ